MKRSNMLVMMLLLLLMMPVIVTRLIARTVVIITITMFTVVVVLAIVLSLSCNAYESAPAERLTSATASSSGFTLWALKLLVRTAP